MFVYAVAKPPATPTDLLIKPPTQRPDPEERLYALYMEYMVYYIQIQKQIITISTYKDSNSWKFKELDAIEDLNALK
jgi:hypothetical protein